MDSGDNAATAAPTEVVRVFLVDDHQVFRSGVNAELSQFPTVTVVGGAGTVGAAIMAIRQTSPDVVLLDVHMPDGGGLRVLTETLANLGEQAPKFLALSVSDAAEDVISIIRGGARGYVTKTIGGAELADAIIRVAHGDAVFSPRLAGFVLDAFAGAAPQAPEPQFDAEVDALTRREKEVLRLIARGYTYREIGEELFISIKTVETHVSHVLRKTQQSNRNALSRWAQSRNLD